MPLFILDTDICIYWLKGNRKIERRIIKQGLENIAITVITECELTYGAFKSGRKEENLRVVEQLKNKIRVIHTSDEVAFYYGKLKAELEKKGSPLDDADLLIASITLANNAVLVTNNTRHFRKIRQLQVENWR